MPFVQSAAAPPRFHLSPAKTVLCIVAIVSRPNALPAPDVTTHATPIAVAAMVAVAAMAVAEAVTDAMEAVTATIAGKSL